MSRSLIDIGLKIRKLIIFFSQDEIDGLPLDFWEESDDDHDDQDHHHDQHDYRDRWNKLKQEEVE